MLQIIPLTVCIKEPKVAIRSILTYTIYLERYCLRFKHSGFTRCLSGEILNPIIHDT